VKHIGGLVDGKCSRFRLGEGGFQKSEKTTDTIVEFATGSVAHYTYTIADKVYSIIGVNTGTKTFTVAGDHASDFAVGSRIRVNDSTGNDGLYTVTSATLVGGDTEITVDESVASAIADGSVSISRLPICKGPNVDNMHHPLRVVEYNGAIVVQYVEDTTGSGVLSGPGGGVGTINYKTGYLDVVFSVPAATGNAVKVEWYYANVPRMPDASRTMLESQEDTQGPDGGSSLYTFSKSIQLSDIVFMGSGTGRIKVTVSLSEPEGLSDGMAWGGMPYYFEGGIFDAQDVLLAYFTFEKEGKTGGTTIVHTVDFVL